MNGSLVQLAEGGIRGKRLSLKNRQSVTFGSDFSCTVILRTEGFKPKQAVMTVGEGNQIWFKNLDTTSDMVKVNGVPVVQPVAIKNADEISFESCVCFVYEADAQAPPAPPLAPPEMLPSDLNVIEQTKLQELLQPKKDDSYQYINEQIKQRKLSNSSSTVPTSATSKESTNEDGAETDDEEKRDPDAHREKVSRESMQVDDKSSKEGGEEEEGDEEESEDHKPEKAEGKKDDMDVGKDHKEEGAEEEEEKKADQSEEKPKPVVERKPAAPSVEGSGEAKVARTTEQGKQSSEVRIKFAASEHANLLQNLLNEGMTGQVNVSKDSVGGLTLTIHFPNVLRGGRRGPPPKQTLKRPTQPQGRPANPPRGPARTTTGGRPGGPTAVGSKRKRSPPPPSIGARGQGGARGPLPRKPPIPAMPGRKVPLRTGGPLTKPGPRPGPGRPPLRTKDAEEEGDEDDTGMFLLPNGHGGLSRRSHRLAQQGPVKKQKTDSEGGEDDATAEGDEKDGEKTTSSAEDEGISKAKRALAKLGRSKHAPHDSDGGGVGMTLLWAAEKVLREERKPMKSPEIIKKGREKGYIATDSKRADNSLVGRFSTSITKDPDTPFVRVSPATYGLKELVSHYKDLGYMDGTSDSKE